MVVKDIRNYLEGGMWEIPEGVGRYGVSKPHTEDGAVRLISPLL